MLLSEVIKHPMDQNGFILSMTEKPNHEKDETKDILNMSINEPKEETKCKG